METKQRDLTLHLNIMNHRPCKKTVSSFVEASTRLKQWRDANDLGSSAFGYNCGLVTQDDKPVAFVSYNGRVWEVEEFEMGHFRPAEHDNSEIKGE